MYVHWKQNRLRFFFITLEEWICRNWVMQKFLNNNSFSVIWIFFLCILKTEQIYIFLYYIGGMICRNWVVQKSLNNLIVLLNTKHDCDEFIIFLIVDYQHFFNDNKFRWNSLRLTFSMIIVADRLSQKIFLNSYFIIFYLLYSNLIWKKLEVCQKQMEWTEI